MKRIYSNYVRLLSVLLVIPFCMFAYAQQQVSGKITSGDGEALPGVNVVLKGTSTGTITALDGTYSITVPNGEAVLSFSSLGYLSEEIEVGNQSDISLVLVEDIQALDEIVVVGYGTQRKKEVTGAVAHVSGEEVAKNATSDFASALQGLVAGVNVQASSGAPGASANIQIRGINTVSGGTNAPLYVVDGVPMTEDPKLSIDEIEDFHVLKDLASASIYGVSGAGGVIIVTTKKGKAGEMKVSLNSYTGIQNITSGMPLQNREEYLYTQMLRYRNIHGGADQDLWTPLANNPDNFTNNTDLYEVLINDNALIQEHSLNLSGGSENMNYNVVAGYFNQQGVLINSGYERFNGRINTQFTKNKLQVGTNIAFSIDEKEIEPWQLLFEAYKYKPFQPDLDPDMEIIQSPGAESTTEMRSVANMMYKLKEQHIEKGERMNGNVQMRYELLKGLTLHSQLGGMTNNVTADLVRPNFHLVNDEGEPINTNLRSEIQNGSSRATNILSESGVTYKRSFGNHNLTMLGVFSIGSETYDKFIAQRFDIVNNDIIVLNGATSDPNAWSGTDQEEWEQTRTTTKIGMLGRVQYNYNERYIMSASIRRDGSSRFAPENRWGYFPSVSVGWNISDEAFWMPLAHIINSAKPRFSLGTAGNDRIRDYSFQPTIALGHDYAFGAETNDELTYGYTQVGYVNNTVKWETSVQKNAGIDLAFFQNQITLEVDMYQTLKKDMLFPILLPTSVGAGLDATVIRNVGNMENKGIDVSLGYKQSGAFSWGARTIFSRNVNEVTSMSGDNKIMYLEYGTVVDGVNNSDRITVIAEGYEAGAFFVMATDGIVNTEERLAEYQKLEPNAKMGDLIYKDSNGDGVIDIEDRVYAGSGAPEYELSLNLNADYKGFDLSMLWYASVGNEIINGGKIFSYMHGTHLDLVYQWSEANPYAVIPADRGSSHDNYRGYADIWVEDGSFLRLKNITLGYTLPKSVMQKLRMDRLRVYIAAQNPVTLTKYEGFDPEVGNDGLATRGLDKGTYPVSRQYRAGIQLSF